MLRPPRVLAYVDDEDSEGRGLRITFFLLLPRSARSPLQWRGWDIGEYRMYIISQESYQISWVNKNLSLGRSIRLSIDHFFTDFFINITGNIMVNIKRSSKRIFRGLLSCAFFILYSQVHLIIIKVQNNAKWN